MNNWKHQLVVILCMVYGIWAWRYSRREDV
jgi:hypothetical protein